MNWHCLISRKEELHAITPQIALDHGPGLGHVDANNGFLQQGVFICHRKSKLGLNQEENEKSR